MRSTLLFAIAFLLTTSAFGAEPWKRHAIDDAFRGADGVRLADFDSDGLLDVTTGWEESGIVRLYLNPGALKCRLPWPAVTIASAASPEDAVAVDLDGDGLLDVVSCHEGKRKQLLVHWNNSKQGQRASVLDRSSWSTMPLSMADGVAWMYALPIKSISQETMLVVGAKGKDASISLVIPSKSRARDPKTWRMVRLRPAGWIMSLRAVDMDGDGDDDVVYSDRRGITQGIGWLEQPNDQTDKWTEHRIAGQGREVMFLSASPHEVITATRHGQWIEYRNDDGNWLSRSYSNPPGVGNGKAIERISPDHIVMTANTKASNDPNQPGIWLRRAAGDWSAIDRTDRVKFDRMELIDLDGDGDLDVMTCEERQNLGVVWYENPGLDR